MLLHDFPDSDDLLAAVVVEANPRQVRSVLRGGETITVRGEGLKFAADNLLEAADQAGLA